MKRPILATLFFFLLPSLSAAAETYEHKKGKVQISFSNYWKVDDSDEDAIAAESKDSSVFLVFGILGEKEFDKIDVSKELSEMLKGIKIREDKKLKHNGMDGWTLSGTGTLEGVKMDFGVLFLVTPAGKIVMGLGFGRPGAYEQKEVDSVFDSIKPLKK